MFADVAMKPVRMAAVEQMPEQVAAPIATTRKPDPTAVAAGALLATVNQTMTALGMERSKVNAPMNERRLVRVKIDGAVRIEMSSITRVRCAGGATSP